MLSFMSGWGEIFAPRHVPFKKELWSFLKGGLYDKAVLLLRDNAQNEELLTVLDEVESSSGMAPLHIACAAGYMELVVELLSLGADITVFGIGGNSALHFAALNERKGIVEILIRSGADLSLPNHNGLLPIELCKTPEVAELFLRDRSLVFSPIAQTRLLLSDYISQLGGNAPPTAYTPKQATNSDTSQAEINSNSNLNAALPSHSHSAQVQVPRDNNDYSLVGVSSVKNNRHDTGAGMTVSPSTNLPHPAPAPAPAPASLGQGGVPLPPPTFDAMDTPSITGSSLIKSRIGMEDVINSDQLTREVLQAAAETAKNLNLHRNDFMTRKKLVEYCQKDLGNGNGEEKFRKLLSFDPSLAMCRLAEMGQLANDGQTPLHVAARFGNVTALKILLDLGTDSSCWVRDVQGKCPLHIAAEHGRKDACDFLREFMKNEKNRRDPVGADAPTDLAGNTPLGWATFRQHKKPQAGIESSLFQPGDASVLPKSPVRYRVGMSPLKPGSSNIGRQSELAASLVFAFSEAKGWREHMEDRIFVSCPIPNKPTWSLFGVCDGHGGDFCANFLSEHIPRLIAKEVALQTKIASIKKTADVDANISLDVLQALLTKVCVEADRLLQIHPRMETERSSMGMVKAPYDSSGSTLVMTLITSTHVVVANVGDSRAVLGLQSSDCSVVRSPFFDIASQSNLTACALSTDHKPDIEEERMRIEASGGNISSSLREDGTQGCLRIKCPNASIELNTSRTFGDFALKSNESLPMDQQAIIAVPEIVCHTRGVKDSFVVLACDGLWDVMTNQEVVDFMAMKLGHTAYGGPVGGILQSTTVSAVDACDALLEEALRRGTQDNLSVILIILGNTQESSPRSESPRSVSPRSGSPRRPNTDSSKSFQSLSSAAGNAAVIATLPSRRPSATSAMKSFQLPISQSSSSSYGAGGGDGGLNGPVAGEWTGEGTGTWGAYSSSPEQSINTNMNNTNIQTKTPQTIYKSAVRVTGGVLPTPDPGNTPMNALGLPESTSPNEGEPLFVRKHLHFEGEH